ncbi:iron complex outermembrane receptor protein [Constrictibacter sp. MBR-5]
MAIRGNRRAGRHARMQGRPRPGLLRTAATSAMAASLAATAPAGAQEAAAQQADPLAPLALDPLVVYGAKTAQTLDDITASVGIVTEADIETHQLRSFRSAFRTLANVADSDWNDAGFVIRGLNSEGLTPGGAPLASFYVDGVQQTVQGTRRGARGLWDVQQVEVYRGPQSTLSGRAALAGTVQVKTNDPTFDYEAAAEGTVGTMETRGGAAMVNVPVVDDILALRIAAEYERSESDLNYPTYRRFDDYGDFKRDEYYQIRSKLLFTPAALPDTRALVTYAFASDSPDIDDIAGPGLGFDWDSERGDFNLPVFAEVRRAKNHSAGAEITHDLSRDLTFTSMTSYVHTNLSRDSINKGTGGETNFVDGNLVEQLATQEFRLNYLADSLAATLGVYGAYQDDDNEYRRPDYFGNSDISRSDAEIYNAALFGEVTYEFVPTWKAVLGGRLDHSSQKGSNFFSRNGAATTDFDYDFDETVFLPKAGIIKELTPGHQLGLTVQRGFRNGGAGLQRSTGETFTFDPEFAWNYELSYKGSFFERRLDIGANVFYADLTDQQVEVQEDPTNFGSTITTNAAESRLYGFELEAKGRVTRELSAFASLGYVHTKFEDFDSSSLGDLSGSRFPEASKWNVAVGADYHHPSGFFVGADAKYTSDFLARFGTAPQETLDGYFVANLQAGYRYRNLTATVFAENVFDEDYFLYNDNDVAATLGPRRVVGLTLKAEL